MEPLINNYWYPVYFLSACYLLALIVGIPLLLMSVKSNREVFLANLKTRRQTEELKRSEELTRSILETVVDGIITIQQDGSISTFNRAAEKIFGYSADEVTGKNVSMLMPEPHCYLHDNYVAEYCKTGNAKIIGLGREVTGLRKDGSEFAMELAVSEVKLKKERFFTGIVRDISERKATQQALEEKTKVIEEHTLAQSKLKEDVERLKVDVFTDRLTQIHNRHFLDADLERRFHLAQQNSSHGFCVAMIDADHFKQINDQFGHLTGDLVLRQIAQILSREARTTDVVARYGGEEFCLVLPATDIYSAEQTVERFRQAIEMHDFDRVDGRTMTVSIGVACYEAFDSSPEEIIARADGELYKAKRNGRNSVSSIHIGSPAHVNTVTPLFAPNLQLRN